MLNDFFTADLFAEDRKALPLDPGALILGGFAVQSAQSLLSDIAMIATTAPFRHLETPGGKRMSVAMTNCGNLGWVSDRNGYRYSKHDPMTGLAWPPLPAAFLALAKHAAATAGFDNFAPEACLVNRYEPGTRLTLHQDRDEATMSAPIVSVSLGLPATFLWGGQTRNARPKRIALYHGDVVVWGGPARMTFHGIDTLADGLHESTGRLRYNLTFRKAA